MNDTNVEKAGDQPARPQKRSSSTRSRFLHQSVLAAIIAAVAALLVASIPSIAEAIKDWRTPPPMCAPSASHLYAAVMDGDEPTVRCLVHQAKINIDMKLQDPKNPALTAPAIYFAVATCNLSLTEYLLERNANGRFVVPAPEPVNLLTVTLVNCPHVPEMFSALALRICPVRIYGSASTTGGSVRITYDAPKECPGPKFE